MEKKKQETNDTCGFGKDVNEYLNHFVTVADAKSGAILAGMFIILAGLSTLTPVTCPQKVIFYLSALSGALSIHFSLTSLYPRLSHAGKGLIFWCSIQKHDNIEEYLTNISQLTKEKIEKEYGKQNWYVSKILQTKHRHIRISIWAFAASASCLSIDFLLQKLL